MISTVSDPLHALDSTILAVPAQVCPLSIIPAKGWASGGCGSHRKVVEGYRDLGANEIAVQSRA